MKLAVISHAYQDERYLATLDAMARSSSDQIAVMHPEVYKGMRYDWKNSHAVCDVPLPVVFGSRQGAFFYRPRALAAALDQFCPDLILHEQEVYALGAAQIAFFSERSAIPLVQFVWENVDRALVTPRRLIRRYVLARTSALIAGSRLARQIHRLWRFNRRIDVVPQMSVNVSPVLRPEVDAPVPLRVCFVGRLVSCKGVDCLLRAIVVLRLRQIGIECTIAGEGPERHRLAALAQTLGVLPQVHFIGHLSESGVQHLLRSSHVLVLPSRRTPIWEEQFGLVLAEAMAEGTIAVGSRTGAIPEVIGANHLLFAEDDANALAEILVRVAADANFRQTCRILAWLRARKYFDVQVVAERKLRFLHAVLDQADAQTREAGTVHWLQPAEPR